MSGKRKNQFDPTVNPTEGREFGIRVPQPSATEPAMFQDQEDESPVSDAVVYPTVNIVHRCGSTSAFTKTPGHDFKTQGAYCGTCKNWYGASEFTLESDGKPLK